MRHFFQHVTQEINYNASPDPEFSALDHNNLKDQLLVFTLAGCGCILEFSRIFVVMQSNY